jgi:hypothetical protein
VLKDDYDVADGRLAEVNNPKGDLAKGHNDLGSGGRAEVGELKGYLPEGDDALGESVHQKKKRANNRQAKSTNGS